MTGRVVVLGSLNLDLVTQVERHPEPGETVLGEGLERLAGGKGANQAMAAAAAGADVAMIGAVGDDDAGRAYVERLQGAGVDTSAIAVLDDEPTGTALIVVGEGAENTIVVVPGANGRVTDAALSVVDAMTPDDVLLVQLEIPLDTVAEACARAAARDVRVVLNIAPYADLPAAVIQVADPLVANEHEAQLLGRTGATPGSRLVTLGAHGAVWDDLGLPAVEVADDELLDTTGAGDAFCGALAAALARGEGREQALQAALEAGGAAVRHRGCAARPAPRLSRSALLGVSLDDDQLVVLVETDVHGAAIGPRDLDLPDGTVLGVALDRVGLAPVGDRQGCSGGLVGLGAGDRVVTVVIACDGDSGAGPDGDDADHGGDADALCAVHVSLLGPGDVLIAAPSMDRGC